MTVSRTLTIVPESGGDASLAELRAFYQAHASHFVKERPPEQLLRAIAGRKMFVLRDEAGALRAVCGLFEHGDGTFREVGGVRVLDNGFGLQALLMNVAVVSEWIFDWPSQPLYAATAKGNGGSIKSIERAGFVEVTDLGLPRMAALGMTELDPGKRYYLFPDTGLMQARAAVRPLLSQPSLARGDDRLELDIKLPLSEFEANI